MGGNIPRARFEIIARRLLNTATRAWPSHVCGLL